MQTIASFLVNHDVLTKGIYISRIDGDITTYDLRMRLPNCEPPMETGALHSLEHLVATVVRNGPMSDRVIYFGPMGCRTGCYLLLRDCSEQQAIDLIRDAVASAAAWSAPLPGSTARECGNCADHDLEGAKREAAQYYEIIRNWKPEDLKYPG